MVGFEQCGKLIIIFWYSHKLEDINDLCNKIYFGNGYFPTILMGGLTLFVAKSAQWVRNLLAVSVNEIIRINDAITIVH